MFPGNIFHHLTKFFILFYSKKDLQEIDGSRVTIWYYLYHAEWVQKLFGLKMNLLFKMCYDRDPINCPVLSTQILKVYKELF